MLVPDGRVLSCLAGGASDGARCEREPESLGAVLRSLRLARGLSQRAVARRLERRHSVVGRWEAGTLEPTFLDLERICRILGATLDELVAVEGPGRRRSSRSHSMHRRATVGLTIGAARRAAQIGFRRAIVTTGIRGRRLDRIEHGADPSLSELRSLLALVGLTAQELSRARIHARGQEI
jgi:transcriptional regulator with XRE-family HTH domain